jgi:coenzyme F420-0:L-glutamate ligase/coenzyme F420-1:gamma-L-glutamate ligase
VNRSLTLIALTGLPEIEQGAPLARLIAEGLSRTGAVMQPADVLVVAQKIISKAEGRRVRLADITPSARARELATSVDKDPRLVELILQESRAVLRTKPGVLIVEHKLGFVMANAGIDQSNVAQSDGEPAVLLLPENPDASARALRDDLRHLCGVDIGIVINDSFGRAWRNGVTGTAIGVCGIPALVDMRGQLDRGGHPLKITQIAAADELAAAASLLMGQADESVPAVLVRGFPYALREGSVQELLRPRGEDLFR